MASGWACFTFFFIENMGKVIPFCLNPPFWLLSYAWKELGEGKRKRKRKRGFLSFLLSPPIQLPPSLLGRRSLLSLYKLPPHSSLYFPLLRERERERGRQRNWAPKPHPTSQQCRKEEVVEEVVEDVSKAVNALGVGVDEEVFPLTPKQTSFPFPQKVAPQL